MSIYKRIQDACKESQISVMALEKKLGFSRGSICKWDENKPSIDRMYAVAKELDKPIEYFLEESE